MKALAAVLMLTSLVAFGGVRLKLTVRTEKDLSGLRARNRVDLYSPTPAECQVTVFALSLIDGAYRVDACESRKFTVSKDNGPWQTEMLGTDPRIKWSWLVIAVADGKVIASVWKYERKRIDPALFIGATVGDIIRKPEDGNDGKKDAAD